MDLFDELVSLGCYSPDSAADLYCARLAFIDTLNTRLHNFQIQWNNHSLSTMKQKTPNQLFVAGAMHHARGDYLETEDMLLGEESANDQCLLYREEDLSVEEPSQNALSIHNLMSVPSEIERNMLDIIAEDRSKDFDLGRRAYFRLRNYFRSVPLD